MFIEKFFKNGIGAAIFLAGALAILFTLLGVFSRRFNKETARSLSAMVYGIICFGTLFSLVGTILGGIWADQSWGRFWRSEFGQANYRKQRKRILIAASEAE